MLNALLKDLLVFAYIGVLATVALYGFHRYVLVYLYVKHRHNGYQPKARFDSLPRVTVQLPMFNEDVVAAVVGRVVGEVDDRAQHLAAGPTEGSAATVADWSNTVPASPSTRTSGEGWRM